MPSKNQLEANRRNALLSTGPKTPEGKARSAQNAVRHGILSREAVLPEEDRREFLDLLTALEAQFQPATPVQEFLVRELACAQWRLRRVARIETGFIVVRTRQARKWEFDEKPPEPPEPTTPEKRHDRDTLALGHAFGQNSGGDPFAKLMRYENTLRRAYYKALDALEESRTAPAPPPAAAVRNEPKSAPPIEPGQPSAPPALAALPRALPNEPSMAPGRHPRP
jgi:hypothetical protein